MTDTTESTQHLTTCANVAYGRHARRAESVIVGDVNRALKAQRALIDTAFIVQEPRSSSLEPSIC